MEEAGPRMDGRVAADPTELISPSLGRAFARASVGPAAPVLGRFQLAFLSAAKVSRLESLSSTPSDLREVSVSLANAAGV